MSAMELYMARSVASEAAIGALNESAQRHVELLDAIESRDKRRIAEQMRTHEAIYTVAEVPPIRDEGAELATTGAA